MKSQKTDEPNNELIATVYSCDIFLALDFLKEKILSLPDAYFKQLAEQRRNDWIINATAQKMLCKIIGRILWKDYDNDGLEIGLAKAQGSGTPISWHGRCRPQWQG
ncbi:MAG: hypothetical protein QXJ27_07055 [Thermoplasmata archaeon]